MTWLEIDLHELQHGSTFDYIEKKKRFKIKQLLVQFQKFKKKSNTRILVFSLMLDPELFCNAKERFFDRALKTMYVYGFIKKILPFFSIMIHAFGKLLKWLILSCCPGTIFYQCTTILVLKYMYTINGTLSNSSYII